MFVQGSSSFQVNITSPSFKVRVNLACLNSKPKHDKKIWAYVNASMSIRLKLYVNASMSIRLKLYVNASMSIRLKLYVNASMSITLKLYLHSTLGAPLCVLSV